MDKQKDFEKIVSEILDSVDMFQSVNNDDEMREAYVDEFTTDQQKKRDKKITELLNQYVDAYCYKNKSNKWYKRILVGMCIVIVFAFSVIFAILLFQINGSNNDMPLEGMIKLITVCITFLALIVSILKIIAKYVFPENDEEYITRIVEIIQNNDLENKKENIKVNTSKK